RSRLLMLAALVTACGGMATVHSAEVDAGVQRFTLPDTHGRDRALDEFRDRQVVVVAFLGTECPLARLYAPRLQQLSEQYAQRGIAFVGIDANQQDSLTDMAAFAQRFGIKFPLLKDRDQTV